MQTTESPPPATSHAADAPAPALGPLVDTPAGPFDRFIDLLDRYRWLIWAALALLYIGGFTASWQFGDDSAGYVAIARAIAAGDGFSHPMEFDEKVLPGLPYLIAAGMMLGDGEPLWPSLTLVWLMGVSIMPLTYALFRLAFDHRTAVAVSIFAGVSRVIYAFTFELIPEVPFLFGLMLFLIGWELLRRAFGTNHWRAVQGRAVQEPGAPENATSIHHRGHMFSAPDAMSAASISSFPRRRESSGGPGRAGQSLDSRLRGNDGRLILTGALVQMAAALVLFAGGLLMMALFRSVVLTFLIGLFCAAGLAMMRRWRWALIGLPIAGAIVLAGLWWLAGMFAPEGRTVTDIDIALKRLAELDTTALRALTEQAPTLLLNVIAAAMTGTDFGVVVAPMLAAVMLVFLARLVMYRPMWAGIVLAFFLQWLFFLTKVRYFSAIQPLIAFAFLAGLAWLMRRWPGRLTHAGVAVLLIVWLATNAVRCIDDASESWSMPGWTPTMAHAAAHPEPLVRLGWRMQQLPRDTVVLLPRQLPVSHQDLIALSRRAVADPRRLERAGLKGKATATIIVDHENPPLRMLRERGYQLGETLLDLPDHPEGPKVRSLVRVK